MMKVMTASDEIQEFHYPSPNTGDTHKETIIIAHHDRALEMVRRNRLKRVAVTQVNAQKFVEGK